MRIIKCLLLLTLIACRDSTAPAPRVPVRGFVSVSLATVLEYVDYGGSGSPLVLLAGLGNTAHVFSGFAPRLADEFRIVAVTRRGFGASSQPPSGYDTHTLAEDIGILLDSLRLAQVDLVGHSVAGDEMTRFAIEHPDRVRKLVYLDAAYDRVSLGSLLEEHPFPDAPLPSSFDLLSPASWSAYIARIRGVSLPAEEIRAIYTFGPGGAIEGEVTPPAVLFALLTGIEAPEWTKVSTPALAIYAVPEDAADVLPWLRPSTPGWSSAQDLVKTVYLPFYRAQRERFRKQMRAGRVLELLGANHYLFLTHGAQVAQAIREFLQDQ